MTFYRNEVARLNKILYPHDDLTKQIIQSKLFIDKHFSENNLYSKRFKADVMRMNDAEPSEAFANEYLQQAKAFVEFAKQYREQAIMAEK